MRPTEVRAHDDKGFATISANDWFVAAATGSGDGADDPVPILPKRPVPQQNAFPLALMAHAETSPSVFAPATLIEVKRSEVVTACGVFPMPQQNGAPSVRRAQKPFDMSSSEEALVQSARPGYICEMPPPVTTRKVVLVAIGTASGPYPFPAQ